MRLVKIDSIGVIINMDKVITLDVLKCDNDYWDFYVNNEFVGKFESTEEKDRVMQMIYEKFRTPGEALWI